MRTLTVKDDMGNVKASGEITRRAGEYIATFTLADGQAYTSRVQMDECDDLSMLRALLQEMEAA